VTPPNTVGVRPTRAQPQTLAAASEPDHKPLADWRRRIGQTIERALELAHLTKQGVSFAMGYQDQGSLSRWMSGVERPHFDKLFAVDRFYDAWVIACAESNPRLDVETTIRVRSAA
jgi:hypothetical protein